MSSKIPIYISNNKGYVWSVQDVTELRVKHRICGTLLGTLPYLTQQNFFLGLPLLLMPEEVVLMIENEIVILVDDSTAIRAPSAAELAEWDEGRKRQVVEQIRLWHEREAARIALETTKSNGKGKMSEAAVRKRKEREERRALSRPESVEGPMILANPPAVTNPQSEEAESQLQAQVHYTVHIPSVSSPWPWYQPSTYDDLPSAKNAGIWSYPQTAHERASCRVFRYLWERGHFLGSGIKFGGEFLVYPGDPLRYHSHFVASVLASPSSILRPMEIVAHGRLGTATKKAHLLCSWDEAKQEVSCYSIEWSGFG